MTVDPYRFPKCELLLPFDGANGATTFPDISQFQRSVTRNGSNAALTTTDPKFGSACLALGGNDFLESAYSFSFPGDFCFDLWLKFTVATLEGGGNRRVIHLPFSIYIETNGKLTLGGTGGFTSTNAFNSGAWVALRLERVGSTVTMYKDGASEGSGTNAGAYSGVLTLGAATASVGRFSGSMDMLRFSNIARNGGAYTPAASAFETD